MKQLLLLSAALFTCGMYAAESQIPNPFARAKELYNASKWAEAYIEYNAVHDAIIKGTLPQNEIDPMHLIDGHVDFADVIFAKAAGEYNNGNINGAKQLMLKACNHWSHRLEGRKFGRTPLDNEWLPGEDIKGKTLAIYSERAGGAFGDSFYATWLFEYAKNQGATVIFIPQTPLSKLYDKTYLPNALQTQHIDHVALRGTEIPKHDKAIYLWSILGHVLNDKTIDRPFPVKPCLSGTQFYNEALDQKIAELTKKYGQEPLLVGGWWRSAGPDVFAADGRKLDRDPGAHRILGTIQNLPVLFINLEEPGRKPLSPEELQKRTEDQTKGKSDEVDVTTYPTDNVFSFGPDFDREIAFGDTIGVMQMIKKRRGVLIGCDTGLCNAAALVEKNEDDYPEESVIAILNERADHRWSDNKTSPRKWHHSKDVIICQAQQQSDWDEPLAQASAIIKNRLAALQQHIQQQQK